jgi:predicted DNA-binding transcriptional regulator AlpA
MMTKPTPAAATPGSPGRLWTAQDVADYLIVPLATLYQWRYLGTGPTAYRVGRYLRYEPAAVQAWLNQHANRSNGLKGSGS